MKRTAIVIVLLAFTTSQAAAFSSPGHQAIADVAQDRLSPTARAALGRILQDSGDLAPGALAAVATWPDDIRARGAHGTAFPQEVPPKPSSRQFREEARLPENAFGKAR